MMAASVLGLQHAPSCCASLLRHGPFFSAAGAFTAQSPSMKRYASFITCAVREANAGCDPATQYRFLGRLLCKASASGSRDASCSCLATAAAAQQQEGFRQYRQLGQLDVRG